MKNQYDLIFSIVAIVVAIVGIVVINQTKRRPIAVAKPEQPVTTELAPPQPPVAFANALPGGSGGASGGGGSSGRGRGPRRMGS